MRYSLFLWFVGVTALCLLPVARAGEPSESQRKWVAEITAEATKLLKDFTPTPETKELVPIALGSMHRVDIAAHPEYGLRSKCGESYAGLLKLAKGQWIYFIVYTDHASPFTNLAFALGHDGNLYRVNTHVCPHLRIRSLDSVAALLETEYPSAFLDGKQVKWEKIGKKDDLPEKQPATDAPKPTEKR